MGEGGRGRTKEKGNEYARTNNGGRIMEDEMAINKEYLEARVE